MSTTARKARKKAHRRNIDRLWLADKIGIPGKRTKARRLMQDDFERTRYVSPRAGRTRHVTATTRRFQPFGRLFQG